MDRKELIEKARELLACGALSKEAADAIKGDFPELKESEDEMHRKWILEYLYDGLRKTDEQFKGQFKSAIAWLENQKEQKPVEWDEYTETNLDRALMIIKKAKGNLQGYQSDDGVYECDKAIECIEHILYRGINIDGLCKPAEWSEEDEVKLNDVIRLIENSGNVKSIIKHYTDFLKSLPERFNLQPKQEWSEEDEEHIQNCLRVIKMKLDEKPYPYYQDYLWLKSLRPQPKRSWTISDAKPGDILTTDTVTFIFKRMDACQCTVPIQYQQPVKTLTSQIQRTSILNMCIPLLLSNGRNFFQTSGNSYPVPIGSPVRSR